MDADSDDLDDVEDVEDVEILTMLWMLWMLIPMILTMSRMLRMLWMLIPMMLMRLMIGHDLSRPRRAQTSDSRVNERALSKSGRFVWVAEEIADGLL